jgi:murein L,D-transpeptidase YafK
MLKNKRTISTLTLAGAGALALIGAGLYLRGAEPDNIISAVKNALSPILDKTSPAERIGEVRQRMTPLLKEELRAAGFTLGDPAFLRVFKETRELELWLKPGDSTVYKKWQTWPIAAMSGQLGPKLKEGDRQAPEGFYSVQQGSLNPQSKYHLSFNIGYPNAFDRAHERTGSLIMVHGNAVSLGCFAMTDPVIEKIYLAVENALAKGQQSVPVHVFPFPMSAERMASAGLDSPELLPFWEQILPGYEAFESHRLPPEVSVADRKYVISPKKPKQQP